MFEDYFCAYCTLVITNHPSQADFSLYQKEKRQTFRSDVLIPMLLHGGRASFFFSEYCRDDCLLFHVHAGGRARMALERNDLLAGQQLVGRQADDALPLPCRLQFQIVRRDLLSCQSLSAVLFFSCLSPAVPL